MGARDAILRWGTGRPERILRSIAQRRGATVLRTGGFDDQRLWFDSESDGALVRVAFATHGPPLFRLAVTFSVTASYVLGRGAVFNVVRDTVLSSTVARPSDRVLDRLSAELRELVVDQHTWVTSPHADVAVDVLQAGVRERVRTILESGFVGAFESDGRTIRFACDFMPPEDCARLMVEAVGDVASRGARWLRGWCDSLEGARFIGPSGDFDARSRPAFEVAIHDRVVRFEPAIVEGRVSLVALLRAECDPFDAALGNGETSMAWARGSRALDEVARVRHARLSSDGSTLRLVFHGAMDGERILAGCRMLSALAAPPPTGAFR